MENRTCKGPDCPHGGNIESDRGPTAELCWRCAGYPVGGEYPIGTKQAAMAKWRVKVAVERLGLSADLLEARPDLVRKASNDYTYQSLA